MASQGVGSYDRDIAYHLVCEIKRAISEGVSWQKACTANGTTAATFWNWEKKFSVLNDKERAVLKKSAERKIKQLGARAFDRKAVRGQSKNTYDPGARNILLTYSSHEHEKKLAAGRNAVVWFLKEEARLVFGTFNKIGPSVLPMMRLQGHVIYDGPRSGCGFLVTEFNRLTDQGLAYCREKGLAPDPKILQSMAARVSAPLNAGSGGGTKRRAPASVRVTRVDALVDGGQAAGVIAGSNLSVAKRNYAEDGQIVVVSVAEEGLPEGLIIGAVRHGVVQKILLPSGRKADLPHVIAGPVCKDWTEVAARLKNMGVPTIAGVKNPVTALKR